MTITLDSVIANFDKKILNKYNIKQTSSIDIYNCYELKFKGAKKILKDFIINILILAKALLVILKSGADAEIIR